MLIYQGCWMCYGADVQEEKMMPAISSSEVGFASWASLSAGPKS
jgi:hypothetical protein